MRTRISLAVLIALVAVQGCGPNVDEEPPPPSAAARPEPEPQVEPKSPFVRAEGTRLVDAQGRHLVLHGTNSVNKTPEPKPEMGRPERFQQMAAWGFNCVRLGFVWAGLEPEPGKYSEEYLDWIAERVGWAKENGLYVLLDMHQDLYGMKFADGAPEWATLDEGLTHIKGAVWSDAYFASQAIQRSFDNFWDNKPGPDGVGIQDHYAGAWKFVAERFADEPAVVGFDLMNEPFIGMEAMTGRMQMLETGGKLVREKTGDETLDTMKLAMMFAEADSRAQLMEWMEDMTIYQPSMDAAAPVVGPFEKGKLTAMYQRVTDAIRSADPHHIVFLETELTCNGGLATAIEPVNGPDGKRDPQQGYTPHCYDMTVDTPQAGKASNVRVEFTMGRHREAQKRLDVPMLVGEWGAYYGGNPGTGKAALFMVGKFEEYLCSETYWEMGGIKADREFFPAVHRPYPSEVPGTLESYRFDPEAQTFTCVWNEAAGMDAPARVYIPARLKPREIEWKLEPAGEIAFEDAGEGTWLIIQATGKAGKRTLTN